MGAQDVSALRPGMMVLAADGETVGRVIETHPEHFVVEKGMLFPSDHDVPADAIAAIDPDGSVRLTLTRDEVANQGWQNPPASFVDSTSPGQGDESYDPTYDRQGDLTAAGREAGDRTTDRDAEGGTGRDELADIARAAEPAVTAGLTGTTDPAATFAIASLPGFTGETAGDGVGPEDADPFADEVVEIPIRIR